MTVGWHVVPERWSLISGTERDVGPAAALKLLGVDGQAERDELTAAAAALGPPSARPMTRAAAWRDALEKGAELSAATLARIDAVAGRRDRIVATGGGVRGAGARAVKEERLGPIEWSPVQEATARGAAALAGVAAGARSYA